MEVEKIANLITSQSQNDYVGLEVGAKTEATHFLGFAVWDDLSVNGASCGVEYFDPLIDQETFGRCDSPIKGWSATNGLDYEIVYQPVMRKDWERMARYTFDLQDRQYQKPSWQSVKVHVQEVQPTQNMNERTSEIDWGNVLEMVALSITALRTPVLAVPMT